MQVALYHEQTCDNSAALVPSPLPLQQAQHETLAEATCAAVDLSNDERNQCIQQ